MHDWRDILVCHDLTIKLKEIVWDTALFKGLNIIVYLILCVGLPSFSTEHGPMTEDSRYHGDNNFVIMTAVTTETIILLLFQA